VPAAARGARERPGARPLPRPRDRRAEPAARSSLRQPYYIATSWVSAWALKTSDGIILIDALNNTREARELIEGALVKLDLAPAQIKFVVVTHGHGDHYGGAGYLVQKYQARVIASEAD